MSTKKPWGGGSLVDEAHRRVMINTDAQPYFRVGAGSPQQPQQGGQNPGVKVFMPGAAYDIRSAIAQESTLPGNKP